VATAPLFIADLATLKPKLRLSGVPTTSDADDIINEAILVARQKFYRELGVSRVAALIALPFNENPTTENQILRAVANSTEVLMVRCELMRTMPMMFMDGNTQQDQIMQDEALFRDTTSAQLEQMKLQCELEIQQNLDLLIGDEDLASETTIRVDTPGVSQPVVDTRTASRPYPGDSVLPGSIKSGLLRNRTLGNN
jgi:hypothetical protein